MFLLYCMSFCQTS